MMNKQMENSSLNNDENSGVDILRSSTGMHKSSNPKGISAYDDLDDYVYKKSIKLKKKSNSSSVRAHSKLSEEDKAEALVVASTRSNKLKRKTRKKRKHKKMKTWKKVVLSIGCTLLGLIVAFAGTVGFLYYNGSNQLFPDDYTILAPEKVPVQNHGEYVEYNGVTYKYNKNITSVLLMGVDRRDFEDEKTIGTAGQSDVNILLTIDTKTGKMNLINISRDAMTEVTKYSVGGSYMGTEKMQLCLAYSFGDGKEKSCENQISAVKKIFYNVPINSYFSLDLDGIAVINDSIGGVDVVSPETIGDFVQGETYHLDGQQAEHFVRSRSHEFTDSNNLRMARQQIYIDAFIKKVLAQTKEDISTPLNLFNAASDYSCTNINASRVCYLAALAVSGSGMSYETMSVPGNATQNGNYAEFNIDETKFYEMFLNVFYEPVN